MKGEADSVPHLDRTASEPRDRSLHALRLARIDQVNATTRLFKLRTTDGGVKFLPGQWLDVYLPGVDQAGGFTITSAPAHATPPVTGTEVLLDIDPGPVERETAAVRPYLELAVQKSPSAPAAWLWRPESEIIDTTVEVRVGGSFVWPPSLSGQEVQRVVFIAGGVGINPLISIISHLHHQNSMPCLVEFLYTTKITDGDILFADRLLHIASRRPDRLKLSFFLTGGTTREIPDLRLQHAAVSLQHRRLTPKDVLEALGDTQVESTVCYVCGPPQMTDELVGLVREQRGMGADRVLCEKWW